MGGGGPSVTVTRLCSPTLVLDYPFPEDKFWAQQTSYKLSSTHSCSSSVSETRRPGCYVQLPAQMTT